MEPGGTADKPPAGQHRVPLDTQQVDALVEVLVVIVPRAVRLRLEAAGVRAHRHSVEGDIPAGHRQVLLYVHIGAVHQGQAVLGHLLIQHDVDSPEGQLSGAELHPGRARADEGGIQEDHTYDDAGLVRAAVRPVGRGGVPADGAHRSPVAGGGALPADNLLRRVAVPASRHQPEHAPGAGAVGPLP